MSTLILSLLSFLAAACALKAAPIQMYEGPSRPNAEVGILRSACQTGAGLTVMVVRIDDKDVPKVCADVALLPGQHRLELSAKQLAPRMDTPMIRSGSILGAPPSRSSDSSPEELPVVWASTSPLLITCPVQAGQEIILVGAVQSGSNWTAECRTRRP